jgi:hypothetical protein
LYFKLGGGYSVWVQVSGLRVQRFRAQRSGLKCNSEKTDILNINFFNL